jgi:signal transduction histidine kinase
VFVHIPDARRSPEYVDNPWVDGRRANVRFYASLPLINPDGFALGTLCLFDVVERSLEPEQMARLEDLGVALVGLFERRRQARRNAELAVEAETQRAQWSLAARELEARTELTRAVLETVDVAIVAAGPDGHLTMFNRAATEWHGLPVDATLDPEEQAQHYDLFEADGTTPLAPHRVPLLRALRDGEVAAAELVIAPADLPRRRVLCSGRSIARADGTPLGAVVAMADVTSDRLQRAELEDAHDQLAMRGVELERSNVELAEFAAVAAHDLRSPLAAIDGYLALLLDVYGDSMADRARDWVGIARTAVSRMLSLTEALLSYAQVGAAGHERRPVEVSDVLGHVLLDLDADLQTAGATVHVQQPLPVVDADPVLLRQLLQNLIANAVGHRDPAAECRIDILCRTTSDRAGSPQSEADAGWTIAVVDHGRGVPAEDRERVFGMFTRVGGGSGASRGAGIGLATCARIVEQHCGRIWIEETPGGGATVCFHLPKTPVGRPEASESRGQVTVP